MSNARNERLWDSRFISAIQALAPGTQLREGLENILRAKMGALVVVDDSPNVMELVDGGFILNCNYSPAAFYEAAKMDGALVLSSDATKILYANAQLIPNSIIPTCETGTRHRTAERMAKQTGALTIAISQRRNLITVYLGELRYALKDIPLILSRANQALQTLEKYKAVLIKGLDKLTAMEFEDIVTLADAAELIVRAEQVNRIAVDIARDIIELGDEGRLVSMQMKELIVDAEIVRLLVRDYSIRLDSLAQEKVFEQLVALPEEELEPYNVCRILGYKITPADIYIPVVPRGYRVLNMIPRLPAMVVDQLVCCFSSLPRIFNATLEELDVVDGISEIRAKTIKDGLKRVREQALINRFL